MNDAVLGVIIGAVVTIVGTLINHWFTLHREKVQWLRQQKAEEEKWSRIEKAKEKERVRQQKQKQEKHIRELYQRSLQSLSALSAQDSGDTEFLIQGDKRLTLIEEAYKSVSALAISNPDTLEKDPDFSTYLNRFSQNPDSWITRLRETIYKFFPKDGKLVRKPEEKHTESTGEEYTIQTYISISNNFRKEQLMQGEFVPSGFSITHDFRKLTQSQRRKLVDTHFEKHNHSLPKNVSLYLPSYNPTSKKIYLENTRWVASLNPKTSTPEEIFNAWESDYDLALEEAKSMSDKES